MSPSSGTERGRAIEHLARTLTERASGSSVTVMLIDVDRFRLVNDAWGLAVGDEVIEAVELRLRAVVRADLVTRLGADEFLMAFVELDQSGIAREAQRVLQALEPAVVIEERTVRLSVSVGLAEAELYARVDLLDLLRNAGAALHLAKSRGGDQIAWFQPELGQAAERRLEMENELSMCVDRAELTLHYQPVCRVLDQKVTGAEALLRWCRPSSEWARPDEFIPVLEDTGLIIPVGAWVLTNAVAQLATWRRSGAVSSSFTLAVNLSPRQLIDPNVVELIRRTLRENEIPAGNLTLEITETAAGSERPEMAATIRALAALGVGISIDDFGTGYSSLVLLRLLPVIQLKIDKQLVLAMTTQSSSAVLTAAIIDLAHQLSLTCVAEGVEDAAQLTQLRDLGCDFGQGFYLGRPVSPSEFIASARQLGTAEQVTEDGPRPSQPTGEDMSVPMLGGRARA